MNKMIEDLSRRLSDSAFTFVNEMQRNFKKELAEQKEELTFVEKNPFTLRRKELLIQVEKKLNEMKNRVFFITQKNIFYVPSDYKVEYIVDRSKRKVTALLIDRSSEKVLHGGTSKCCEGEVFNVDLGKFISTWKMFYGTLSNLHPGYLNASQPTEFEEGQIVVHKLNTGVFKVEGELKAIKNDRSSPSNLIYREGMVPVQAIYSVMKNVSGEQFNCRIEELRIVEDSKELDVDFDFYRDSFDTSKIYDNGKIARNF